MDPSVIVNALMSVIQYKAKYLTLTELEALMECLIHYRTEAQKQ